MKESTQYLIESIYRDHQETIKYISAVITPQSDAIATAFYQEMLTHPEASAFLDNALVSERLHGSMSRWVRSLFDPGQIEDVEGFINWQLEIGRVHARIRIPMHLFTKGIRSLKRQFSKSLFESTLNREELVNALLLIGELMDHLTDLIDSSFIENTLDSERNIQALQLEMINGNLALECERLRLSLSDWMRDTLIMLYSNNVNKASRVLDVKGSDYGLWVMHKMDLLFPNNIYVPKQNALLTKMNELVQQAVSHRVGGHVEACERVIQQLSEMVKEASFMLGSMIEQMLSMETSRDPLTQMLNRRYLSVIMQREIEVSQKQGLKFAVMFIDLDHFKKINDQYGHDTGDRVLSSAATIIHNMIRPGDFVFRYGGEEFLAMLTHISEKQALEVAERMREKIEGHSLMLDEGCIQITASIGIAMYDGHPDYQRVINRADEAVYLAKDQGRNRSVMAA